MKDHTFFSRGDNYEIAKIHIQNYTKYRKIFFSITIGPILTNLGTMHPWVTGIQVCLNEEPLNSQKVNNVFFPLNQHYVH